MAQQAQDDLNRLDSKITEEFRRLLDDGLDERERLERAIEAQHARLFKQAKAPA